MNIKFVLFPRTGKLAQLQIDVDPGTTIKQLENKLLSIDGFVISEIELIASNCLVDGLYVERDYIITDKDQEISFVNQILGGC